MEAKEKNYIVYMHTNLVNNKKYIGITGQKNYKKRWSNGLGYCKQVKFYRAIQKYGWVNFKHEILYSELTLEEACLLEKELISYYNTIANGYNSSEGGELSGYEHSEETIQKLKNLVWITNGTVNKRIYNTTSIEQYPGFWFGFTITDAQKRYQELRAKTAAANKELELLQWKQTDHFCKTCGKLMINKYGRGDYCCKACAVTHAHSPETKTKLAELNRAGICGIKNKHLSAEQKQKHSVATSSYYKNCKTVWISYNNELEKRIPETQLAEYLDSGWIRGKIKGRQIAWNRGKHFEQKRKVITKNNIEKRVLETELQEYLNNGWQLGKPNRRNKNEN